MICLKMKQGFGGIAGGLVQIVQQSVNICQHRKMMPVFEQLIAFGCIFQGLPDITGFIIKIT
ncbi:hypothetical protein DSECCO2_524680 [anaerobic digester metagenome]